MSSFEEKVRQHRKYTPWAQIDFTLMMMDLALLGPVSLSCQLRPDVVSRYWWKITWTGGDEHPHEVTAQTREHALWRCAVMELSIRSRVRSARKNTILADE